MHWEVITELFGREPLWPKMSAFRIMARVTIEGGYPETHHLPEKYSKLPHVALLMLKNGQTRRYPSYVSEFSLSYALEYSILIPLHHHYILFSFYCISNCQMIIIYIPITFIKFRKSDRASSQFLAGMNQLFSSRRISASSKNSILAGEALRDILLTELYIQVIIRNLQS